MPAHDLDLLIRAAEEGGRIAMRHWGKAPQMWDKPGGAGPVSEADLAVDRYLHDTLLAARPDHGWLSEETADTPERLGCARVFVVDPIDGTRAFLKGERDFALSLALVEAGRTMAAVVHLPAHDLTFAATATGPAMRNGARLTLPQAAGSGRPTVLTSRPSFDPVHWKGGQPPPLDRHFRPSIAYRLCLVAEGRFDSMMTLRPAWEWDVAAGVLIAERAGAIVTDPSGRPVTLNAAHPQAPGLVVAAPGLHADILARLRPIPPATPLEAPGTLA